MDKLGWGCSDALFRARFRVEESRPGVTHSLFIPWGCAVGPRMILHVRHIIARVRNMVLRCFMT